jgi:hypothetical protein
LYYLTYVFFGELIALQADTADGERARAFEIARSYAARMLGNTRFEER